MSILFASTKLGSLELKNHVVMAPMTRSRAIGNVANDLMATYYQQRAGAGLIVTEGIAPSPNALGYARIPGLFNAEQAAGWKKTTKSVHAGGAKIFAQLMHTGRVGHPLNLPKGARVIGPSAVAAPDTMYTDAEGPQPHPVPHAMSATEIESTLGEYVASAELAIDAGFDGVELHGANGYLIDQFLNTASNQRTDEWGGSPANRARFAIEVAKRVAAKIGPDRVGIRLSPYGAFNGMVADAHIDALYELLAKELSSLKIAYIHVVDHSSMGAPKPKVELIRAMRRAFGGAFILSGGYDRGRAEADLNEKHGDLIAFGRPFISNPDLVSKLQSGAKQRDADFSTFYTPGEKGYTDYPVGSPQ